MIMRSQGKKRRKKSTCTSSTVEVLMVSSVILVRSFVQLLLITLRLAQVDIISIVRRQDVIVHVGLKVVTVTWLSSTETDVRIVQWVQTSRGGKTRLLSGVGVGVVHTWWSHAPATAAARVAVVGVSGTSVGQLLHAPGVVTLSRH